MDASCERVSTNSPYLASQRPQAIEVRKILLYIDFDGIFISQLDIDEKGGD